MAIIKNVDILNKREVLVGSERIAVSEDSFISIEQILGAEEVTITLSTNQAGSDSDLIGCKVSLKIGNYLRTEDWVGDPIIFQIAAGSEYTISVSNVTGYSTPPEEAHTATYNMTRDVELTYSTEVVQTMMLSNMGESVSGVASVNCAAPVAELPGGGFMIPFGEDYTVEGEPVEGYQTPDPVNATSRTQSRDVTLCYGKANVIIDVCTEFGEDCRGQIVTIDGVDYTYNNSPIQIQVPLGEEELSISVNDKDTYDTPAERVITPSCSDNFVTITYERHHENSLGIYIETLEGRWRTENEWRDEEGSKGIIMSLENNHKTRISLIDAGSTSFGEGTNEVNDINQALVDFSGLENTTNLIVNPSANAAHMAHQFEFESVQWYLPAYGELRSLQTNLGIVNNLLGLIGGDLMDENRNYWSSTEKDSSTCFTNREPKERISVCTVRPFSKL